MRAENLRELKVFTVTAAAPGTLNDVLRAEIPSRLCREVSNGKIRRLIMAGAVRLDGVPCRNPSVLVRAGESVSVRVDVGKLFYEKPVNDIAFELTARDVLYEDECIIVVNKPACFPTEVGMVASRDNLHAAVVRYLFANARRSYPNLRNPPYAGIMHRLDRETSGVILFTKTREVNVACHALFEERVAQKTYRAVVSPVPRCKRCSVEMFMGRISPKSQPAKWGAVAERDGGVYARTDISVVAQGDLGGKPVAFVECRPHTGRTHQIRVHLASLGAPILGDVLYDGQRFARIMLHAQTLSFPHPVTHEPISITAPLPDGFDL
ncbi:MAG: RluA family pseudouridine synthase [Treponemataceae bacterium]|nr:RluA family pseudouridine synthase [Treponemataceae bacterium]